MDFWNLAQFSFQQLNLLCCNVQKTVYNGTEKRSIPEEESYVTF